MKYLEDIILFVMFLSVVMVIFSKKTVNSLIYLGVFSLFLTLAYFIMHAPDVAITEASLGSGLSVLIYMIAIKKTGGGEE